MDVDGGLDTDEVRLVGVQHERAVQDVAAGVRVAGERLVLHAAFRRARVPGEVDAGGTGTTGERKACDEQEARKTGAHGESLPLERGWHELRASGDRVGPSIAGVWGRPALPGNRLTWAQWSRPASRGVSANPFVTIMLGSPSSECKRNEPTT